MNELSNLETIVVSYVLPILFFYVVAYIVHRLSTPLAARLRPLGNITMRDMPRRYERLKTLQSLMSNAISILAFIIATLVSLTLFVSAESLLWVIGLFSAAFGLGARPFISDFLTGISFIFEDSFDVGDKIEIPLSPKTVEGVVEEVNLRVTRIRGMEGELFTMPNGDIRVIRNFSRGDSSPTSVTITLPAYNLAKALDILESISEHAMTKLPNLIEPWQVINKSGVLTEEAELTILARAKFGKGAELRTRMLALVHEELSAQGLLVEPKADDNDQPPNEKTQV